MKILKRGLSWAFAVFSVLLTLLPESIFSQICFIEKETVERSKYFSWVDATSCNVTISRLLFLISLLIILTFISWIYRKVRRVKINGNNYSVVIEYGNLLKKKKCHRIINFDECFTCTVGTGTAEIKADTVCGQYLLANPRLNIKELIVASGVKPCERKSSYRNLICYEPGTIITNGDDFLMAFTRLEANGKSMKFTVEEYLKCLSLMWEEIDNHFCNKDVYIPILGSGLARFENGSSQSISKQELVNLMIASYTVSPFKIKNSNTLHIVCKRSDDFSMDKVN